MLTHKCSQASNTKIAIDDVSIFAFNKDYMNLKCYYRVVEFKSGWKSIKNWNWPTPISPHKYTHTYTHACIHSRVFQWVYKRTRSSGTVVIYRKHNPFSHEPPRFQWILFLLMLSPFTWMRVNHRGMNCSFSPLGIRCYHWNVIVRICSACLHRTHAHWPLSHSPVSDCVYFTFYATFWCLLCGNHKKGNHWHILWANIIGSH